MGVNKEIAAGPDWDVYNHQLLENILQQCSCVVLTKLMALASAPRTTQMCIILPVILTRLSNKDKQHCILSSLNSAEGEAQTCEIKRNQKLKPYCNFWVTYMQSVFTLQQEKVIMENGLHITNQCYEHYSLSEQVKIVALQYMHAKEC